MDKTKSLDCTGLMCPMPVVKAKLELEEMKSGEVLEVVADDPGFEKDFPAWCKQTGNTFIELEIENGVFKGYVMKK
ncbi:MAG: sulfurtransferase TusA family protein [bacterium]